MAQRRGGKFRVCGINLNIGSVHSACPATICVGGQCGNLVVFDEKKATREVLAEKLVPPVRLKDVATALSQLQSLGLVFKDEAGCWRQSEEIVTTGPEVKSLLVANFHRQMIKLATESIDRFPADQRDISAVTLSISKKNIPEIKKKIMEFRISDNFLKTYS